MNDAILEELNMKYDYDLGLNKELTKRHGYDMKSDSWLSKNVRPLGLIVLVGAYVIFLGGCLIYKVSEIPQYLAGLEGLIQLYMGFYVSSRSVEKTSSIIKGEVKKK